MRSKRSRIPWKRRNSSVEDAESELENTQDSLEDYEITAPISGQVIVKNTKAGDTPQQRRRQQHGDGDHIRYVGAHLRHVCG